jgi:hypothetical protein
LNLATAQSDAEAGKKRDIVTEKMTPAQIAAQKLARKWKPKPEQ